MATNDIAIIGGSGVYSMFAEHNTIKKNISTPFGTVNYSEVEYNNHRIIFLPRHGESHAIPPHKINFKANIYALFLLGVKRIISTNAVGSLKQEIKPGHFVVINQFIDITSGPVTFFDGNFEVQLETKTKKGVVHTDMTEPYSENLRLSLIKSLEMFPDENFHSKGCYVMFQGPRFETSAEIAMIKNFGDVVGMTGAPEVILARELEMEYATLNLVTNYGAGLQKEITHSEVIELFNQKVKIIQEILKKSLNFIL